MKTSMNTVCATEDEFLTMCVDAYEKHRFMENFYRDLEEAEKQFERGEYCNGEDIMRELREKYHV